ncbi:MAG: hypothetical protein PVI57_07435 [Gemmatimonadota bacterium]|jgi:hypothetical protein
MATWLITVRHGTRYQRYHTLEVEAADVRGAMRRAADAVPEGIAEHADLVEVRPAVRPEERSYVGESD